MAEVWAEMQTQVEETSRRLLPLESSNHEASVKTSIVQTILTP
jgi:hypothetical protein